jgi:O-antigen ligase
MKAAKKDVILAILIGVAFSFLSFFKPSLTVMLAATLFIIPFLVKNPASVFYFAVSTLSFQTLAVSFGGATFKLSEFLFLSILMFSIWMILLQRKSIQVPRVTYFLLLFIFFCVVSVILAPTPPDLGAANAVGKNSPALRSLFTTAWLIFNTCIFLLIVNLVNNREKLVKVVRVFILSGTVLSGLGIAVFFIALVFPDLVESLTSPWVVPRVKMFSYESGYFANYLITIIPITISLYLRNDSQVFHRRNLLFQIAVQCLCLFLTFSTAGWGSLFISLAIFLLMNNKKYIKPFLTYGLIAFILIVPFYYFNSTVHQLIDSTINKELHPERTFGRQVASELFASHPWIGVGFGNSDLYVVMSKQMVTVNHLYLGLLADVGILGFFSFLLFIIFLFYKMYQGYTQAKDDASLQAIIKGAFYSIIAVGIQYIAISNINIIYIWFLLSLAVAASVVAGNRPTTLRS